MDDMSIQGEPIDQALRELTVINSKLGGFSASIRGIRMVAEQVPQTETLSILDAGSGGGDIVTVVSSIRTDSTITALDLNHSACEYAARIRPSLHVVQGSVLALPFKDQSFDIVHTSLFLHHFTESELSEIVKSLLAVSRYGIIINDLRRSLFAYLGITLLTRLFSQSPMVKNDGPLSVTKGFTKKELQQLCSRLSSVSFSIHRRWAFRWLVCIKKLS
ncbi:MAG TPA: methyltransferase domain-containing protein [Bacteroidota bacterium]|nr:methyltransferase domain-containing protein [Bacteroidota bacterium]